MKRKALFIGTAFAAVLGLSGFAFGQTPHYNQWSTPHIQSDGGHSGRMISGREMYAPRAVVPFIAPYGYGWRPYWDGWYYDY